MSLLEPAFLAAGLSAYYPQVEQYERVGLHQNGFRITRLNHGYELCDTYPKLLVVPASISDAILRSASNFRSRNRLPAVTWRHPATGAVLARCSQPLAGYGDVSSSAPGKITFSMAAD
jgi:hypothetical protein